MGKYVIGLAFGEESIHSELVCAVTGHTEAVADKVYPRWQEGLYCDALSYSYRQHPLDYLEVMTDAVHDLVKSVSQQIANNVVGLSLATCGCVPAWTNAQAVPLALLPHHAHNPNAMFVMSKDASAHLEATQINALCKQWKIDYRVFTGGLYEFDAFWSKALHVLRADAAIQADAFSVVDLCEWIPAQLTGVRDVMRLVRSRCVHGHKSLWHAIWDGLPNERFFARLDPLFKGLRERMFEKTVTADKPVGKLTPEWASRMGLSEDVIVSGGALDVQMGAVGAGVALNAPVRMTGANSYDVWVVSPNEVSTRIVNGAYGQVNGSVIPSLTGILTPAGSLAMGSLALEKAPRECSTASYAAFGAALFAATAAGLYPNIEAAQRAMVPIRH